MSYTCHGWDPRGNGIWVHRYCLVTVSEPLRGMTSVCLQDYLHHELMLLVPTQIQDHRIYTSLVDLLSPTWTDSNRGAHVRQATHSVHALQRVCTTATRELSESSLQCFFSGLCPWGMFQPEWSDQITVFKVTLNRFSQWGCATSLIPAWLSSFYF